MSLGYVIGALVVLVLVGVGVAWEMFRARMEELQQGQGGEAKLGVSGGPIGFQRDGKSREVRVGDEAASVPVEEDELSALGKKKKPPPPKPLNLAPSERAWRSVKADFDRLEGRNETTARKYRIRILALEDRKVSAPEATFVKEAGALETQLKSELAKPENQ